MVTRSLVLLAVVLGAPGCALFYLAGDADSGDAAPVLPAGCSYFTPDAAHEARFDCYTADMPVPVLCDYRGADLDSCDCAHPPGFTYHDAGATPCCCPSND